MKRTFLFVAASMLLAGICAFADEATVIDFTLLKPDCVADENGNPTENGHTVMDFSTAANNAGLLSKSFLENFLASSGV